MLASGIRVVDNSGMTTGPRHNQMNGLIRELRGIEDRAFALSVYDYPDDMSMSDLVVFALRMYDTPDRAVDPELLKEVFAKTGKFGVVAIKGAVMDTPPYVHLGQYGDSLEYLERTGLITIGSEMQLTEVGSQLGAAMINSIIANGNAHPASS